MAKNSKKWWGVYSNDGELVKKIEETEEKAREIHEMVKSKGFYVKGMKKSPSRFPNLKIYKVKNKKKYIGKEEPIARSAWEYEFMKYLDKHPHVSEWASEIPEVPYVHPVRTLQEGRQIVWMYHPDFYVKYSNGSKTWIELIEIKPFKQTIQPLPPGNGKTQALYESEMETYAVNTEKWKAAQAFCKLRGWSFRILTEKELGIKG
jgi:hypothetical protein